MDKTTDKRFYSMDAARGILMTLGIFLHAANIYRAEPTWRIYDPTGGPVFDIIVLVIHTFRMPAFFIIAGFFCMLTLMRYGPDLFYRRRLVRIGVPLLFVGLVLNTVQAFLTGTPVPGPLAMSYWLTDGGWISHLWFLLYLLVYFTVVVLLAKWQATHALFRRAMDLVGTAARRPQACILLLTLVLLPAMTMMLPISAKLLPFLHMSLFGLFSALDLLHYGLFFAFGAVLYFQRDLLSAFSAPPFWLFLFLLPAAAIAVMFADAAPIPLKLAQAYAAAVVAWLSCSLVFFIFDKGFSKPSNRFMKMADASYTIYLLHHLLVVLFGMALMDVALPAGIKFALIVTATFTLTYAVHRLLVLRFRPLHFLLNGVASRAPKSVMPAVAEAVKSG